MAELLSLITLFVPLFLILWIANVAQGRREAEEPYAGLSLAAQICVAVLFGLGVLGGLMLQVAGALIRSQPQMMEEMGDMMPFESLGLVASGLWAPSVVGLILLLPPVRRAIARYIDLDADNPVHIISLPFSMLIVINLVMTLGVGLDNMANLVAEAEETRSQGTSTMLTLWGQQILTALLAMVGVGWLARRTLKESLARLGLTGVSWRQAGLGAGLGVLMVPVVSGMEWLASLIGMGPSIDVERLTEELLGPLIETPFGILTLGLAAALGEEPLFRGALTPRFGILLSSLLFALLHSNYGITLSTGIVLLLGVVLAVVRQRHNTTTAMILHAVYNIVLGILAYISMNMLDLSMPQDF